MVIVRRDWARCLAVTKMIYNLINSKIIHLQTSSFLEGVTFFLHLI